jgi:hypothetical protein
MDFYFARTNKQMTINQRTERETKKCFVASTTTYENLHSNNGRFDKYILQLGEEIFTGKI